MVGNAYKYNMPSGVPGAPNRVGGNGVMDIEAVILDSANALGAFGLFGILDSVTGLFRKLTNTDTTVYGLLVRAFPLSQLTTSNYSGAVAIGTAVPPTSGTAPVMRSGYMTVKLQPSNAGVYPAIVKGAPVYACIQNPNAAGFVGGVMGTTDGGNAVAVSNCIFMGPPDADNNIEIAYNI
jgi:hypothetical protein